MGKRVKRRVLRSVEDVVITLGGVAAVAELTGVTQNQVHNWRADRKISARFYVLMARRLAYRRLKAKPELWGQVNDDVAA
jgi:hypothetical protein